MLADIAPILARVDENGGPFWSRADGNIHAPSGWNTIEVLGVLGDLGATPADDPLIAGAVDLVAGYQRPDGAFRYAERTSKLPCITANILRGFGRLGLGHAEVAQRAYAWLAPLQRPDGGWRCAAGRYGRSPEIDASDPGTTLFVLDAWRLAPEPHPGAGAAVAFLLDHWQSRAPLGPCAFGIGSRFMKVEYPFLRYNLPFYVHVLAHYPEARADPRFREALDTLRGHLVDGHLSVEAPNRAWKDLPFGAKGAVHAALDARWGEITALAM